MSSKEKLLIGNGFTANFTIVTEGYYLVIYYRGKEYLRQNMKFNRTMLKDFEAHTSVIPSNEKLVSAGEGFEEIAITHAETLKFIQAYQGLQKKYTGMCGSYPPPAAGQKATTKSNWAAFERAAVQAKQFNIDPVTYISKFITHYSRRANRSEGAALSLPYPNQLSGDIAQQIFVDEVARGTVEGIPPAIRASRLAGTNRYVPLDKDQAYMECFERAKKRVHTRFDIEYLKLRLTQVLGEPKAWVLKLEREMNEQENDNEE